MYDLVACLVYNMGSGSINQNKIRGHAVDAQTQATLIADELALEDSRRNARAATKSATLSQDKQLSSDAILY
jgi:hypothetical protein